MGRTGLIVQIRFDFLSNDAYDGRANLKDPKLLGKLSPLPGEGVKLWVKASNSP
jgi:hypothetical protein